jgi:ApbE superfamily uncharacterized protein (UPF0280 family)
VFASLSGGFAWGGDVQLHSQRDFSVGMVQNIGWALREKGITSH